MRNRWLKTNKIKIIKVAPVENPISNWSYMSSMRSWPIESLNRLYKIEYFESTKINNNGSLFDVVFYRSYVTNDDIQYWSWSEYTDWHNFWKENEDMLERSC